MNPSAGRHRPGVAYPLHYRVAQGFSGNPDRGSSFLPGGGGGFRVKGRH